MTGSLWGVEPGRGAARRRSLAGIDEGLSTARPVSADTWLGCAPLATGNGLVVSAYATNQKVST